MNVAQSKLAILYTTVIWESIKQGLLL